MSDVAQLAMTAWMIGATISCCFIIAAWTDQFTADEKAAFPFTHVLAVVFAAWWRCMLFWPCYAALCARHGRNVAKGSGDGE